MRWFSFFIGIFLFLSPAFADEIEKPVEKQSKIEEFFEALEGPVLVQGVLELPFYSFYLGAPNVKGVAYLPSFAPRLGPRIMWKNIGATVTFALPIPKNEKYRRGTSDQRNFILNSYWRQNAVDLYYQKFRSFYVSSPFRELSVNKPARYPQLPDAEVTNDHVVRVDEKIPADERDARRRRSLPRDRDERLLD